MPNCRGRRLSRIRNGDRINCSIVPLRLKLTESIEVPLHGLGWLFVVFSTSATFGPGLDDGRLDETHLMGETDNLSLTRLGEDQTVDEELDDELKTHRAIQCVSQFYDTPIFMRKLPFLLVNGRSIAWMTWKGTRVSH